MKLEKGQKVKYIGAAKTYIMSNGQSISGEEFIVTSDVEVSNESFVVISNPIDIDKIHGEALIQNVKLDKEKADKVKEQKKAESKPEQTKIK